MLFNVSSSITAALGSGEYYTKSGPTALELDDTASWYLELNDPGGDVIAVGEITPGSYTIDRLRNGVTTNIVALSAASEAAGRIYATYTPTAANWALGDVILVTFSGGTITISGSGVTTTLPSAYFYTRLTREEDITTSLGAQGDAAVQTTADATVQGAVKGLRTSLGNPSGDTLTTITAKLGNGALSNAQLHSVTTANTVNNDNVRDIVGNKTDTAVRTVGVTTSLMAYLKAAIDAVGDHSADSLTSIRAKFGNLTESLLTLLGARADAAVQTTADASMHARLKGLLTSLGNPSGDTLTSVTAKIGNNAEALTTTLGAQADAAVQSAANATLQASNKGIRTSIGDPSGHSLTSLTAKWGNLAQSFAAWAGDMSAHSLTSIAAKWGNMTETLLVVLGARADAATQTTADASMHSRLKGLLTSLGNPSADTLTSITAKIGNNAEALTTTLGVQADAAVQGTGNATLQAGVKGLRTSVGDPSGGTLTSLAARFGNLSLALNAILQPTRTDGSVGPSDFNAGAITVVSLDTTQNTMVSGIYIDCNGFTNGAILTATLKIKVGAGNNARQVQKTFTKDADNNLFIILDSEAPITSNTDSLDVTLKSNNAGDVAVTVPFTYFTRSVS